MPWIRDKHATWKFMVRFDYVCKVEEEEDDDELVLKLKKKSTTADYSFEANDWDFNGKIMYEKVNF